jgi:hypothetical protein
VETSEELLGSLSRSPGDSSRLWPGLWLQKVIGRLRDLSIGESSEVLAGRRR